VHGSSGRQSSHKPADDLNPQAGTAALVIRTPVGCLPGKRRQTGGLSLAEKRPMAIFDEELVDLGVHRWPPVCAG
jgi:hypothetical protein